MADPRLADTSLWLRFFTESYNGGIDQLWRPVVSLSFAVQHQLHGLTAWPYHAVNWLLHGVVTAMVSLLAGRLAGGRAAWVAGLLFAVLPIHTEAVVNLAGRAELLAAAFSLGSLLMLIGRPITPPRGTIAILLFALGLLCKEHVLMMPFIVAILANAARPTESDETQESGEPQESGELTKAGNTQRQAMKATVAGMLVLVAAVVLFRESSDNLALSWDQVKLPWDINPLAAASGLARHVWLPMEILGRYAMQTVMPLTLSADHNFAVITPQPHWPMVVYGACAALFWVTLVALAWRSGRRTAAACLLAAAIAYLPASNALTLIGTAFGERLMYLPSAFLLCGIALLLSPTGTPDATVPPPRSTASRRAMLGVVLMLLVAVYGVRSFTYALTWNDELGFWQRQAATQPRSVRIRVNLADVLRRRDQLDAAADVAAGARQDFPAVSDVWIVSGMIAIQQRRYPQAEQWLQHSLTLDPRKRAIPLLGQVGDDPADRGGL